MMLVGGAKDLSEPRPPIGYTLTSLGASVYGLGLKPATQPSLFTSCNVESNCEVHYLDICDYKSVSSLIKLIQPDFVFNLAAQALVRDSVLDPLNTWNTNVIGTCNILNSLRFIHNTCSCVIVTSDKCYLNNE